ncbi:hypothetical protein BDP67DRAFT_487347 [Colletotrichum lupini]|nr:hypothetical protein BDP67DRAFT_487347 [Colletotrichum lupini]
MECICVISGGVKYDAEQGKWPFGRTSGRINRSLANELALPTNHLFNSLQQSASKPRGTRYVVNRALQSFVLNMFTSDYLFTASDGDIQVRLLLRYAQAIIPDAIMGGLEQVCSTVVVPVIFVPFRRDLRMVEPAQVAINDKKPGTLRHSGRDAFISLGISAQVQELAPLVSNCRTPTWPPRIAADADT